MGEKDNEVFVLWNLGGRGRREKRCEVEGRIIGACEEVGGLMEGLWAIEREQGGNWT